MSPLVSRGLALSRRLWKTTRHDIGRKLTALLMAIALWSALQNFVIARQPLELQVHSVPTQEEANSQRSTTAGVYLIVPDDLIVRSVSEPRVHLTVTGLRDEVVGLNLSAKLLFTGADLGGADEITLKRPLERDVFSAPPGQTNPRLTGFRAQPDVLEVTLARRETADITLVADSVVITGKPKDGYLFRTSRITLQPSTVGLTGPRRVLEPLLADAGKIKLAPVDVAGRSFTVSQQVGLSHELLEQGVTLTSPRSGQILVTVPIEAEEIYRELLRVPIAYRNEDVLELRRQRASGYPETLDIRIVGPPAELNDRTSEELLESILLDFDWDRAPQSFEGPATGKVNAFTFQLPPSVSVTDLKGNQDLKIEYTLEAVVPPGAADDK